MSKRSAEDGVAGSHIQRSISACKLCRKRKAKCDRAFPKCGRCQRKGEECVGLDAATGREVPRSYVTHLEQTVARLKAKLEASGLDPNDLPTDSPTTQESPRPVSALDPIYKGKAMMAKVESSTASSGTKAPQSYLGSSLGISFAKLMLAAVNFKTDDSKAVTPQPGVAHSKAVPLVDPSMLRQATQAEPSALVPKDIAIQLLIINFAQSNPQLPVFHREEFIKKYFEPIYGTFPTDVSLASDSTPINRSGFNENIDEKDTWYYKYSQRLQKLEEKSDKTEPLEDFAGPNATVEKMAAKIKVPKQYHIPLYFLNMAFAIASAAYNMQFPFMVAEKYKAAALKYMDAVYASPDRLECLQAILLLTVYSLMRPAVPGVWYVLGSALRICVDLGLHTETSISSKNQYDAFTLDMRRRLFWCCYSLDRQVCVYLGRPFGIPEESVHVPFFSTLDDAHIVRDPEVHDYSTRTSSAPTYKIVSLGIFQIRQIQAQVQSILYEKAELPRRFSSLDEWKTDINTRLDLWMENLKQKASRFNCDFNFLFFNLNYHHTKLILNGLSPGTLSLTPENYSVVENASKEVISTYYRLYSMKAINYTWAGVHNLFMAGTSYLYAIYHSAEVRDRTSLEEIQTVTFECSLVLDSLIETCDAAAHCKDTFDILTAAVIRLRCNSKTANTKDIPPESVIAKAQPGKHVPEHLKDLLNSLPQDQPFQAPSPRVKGEDEADYDWPPDKHDMDRFFEQLDHVESPESGRSYSSPRTSLDKMRGSQRIYATPDTISYTPKLSSVSPELYIKQDSSSTASSSETEPQALSPDLSSSREGHKVFKMIYQVPTESIWDQFFATPYSNDGTPE